MPDKERLARLETTLVGMAETLKEVAIGVKQVADVDKRLAELIVKHENRDEDMSILFGQIREARTLADEANAKSEAIVNRFNGAKWAWGIGAVMFGGLVSAAVLWVMTSTADSLKQIAILNYRVEQQEKRNP